MKTMLNAIQRRLLAELFATIGSPEFVNDESVSDVAKAIEMIDNEAESIIEFPSKQWVCIIPGNGADWLSDFSINLRQTIETLRYPPSLETAAADLYEAARFYSHSAGSCLYGFTDRAADCGCDWHLCCHAVALADQEA